MVGVWWYLGEKSKSWLHSLFCDEWHLMHITRLALNHSEAEETHTRAHTHLHTFFRRHASTTRYETIFWPSFSC
jgi:hypothetical protein